MKPKALFCLILLTLFASLIPAMHAQNFSVIYNFTGGAGGASPAAGLTMDSGGNFYGTTYSGGNSGTYCGTDGCGTIFKLSKVDANWVLIRLYAFRGLNDLGYKDGANPMGRVAIAQDGTLYGTTYYGGGGQQCVLPGAQGCGTVFRLKPATPPCATVLCNWTETVLHSFTGGSDGGSPQGDLIFDQSGNLYGSAQNGGYYGLGAIYELRHNGNSWDETVIYSPDGDHGNNPSGGVTFDQAGNLYGVLPGGGLECNLPYYCGAIYQLSPSGPTWTANTIYFFDGHDGSNPVGGLIMDSSGNLYGTTPGGVDGGGGTVFELIPGNPGWTINTLTRFQSSDYYGGPQDKLVMDSAGNLYGTTFRQGTHDLGTLFRLSPSSHGWTYTLLHDFTGGSDGAWPRTNLVLDANGNLYGTASAGGTGSACDYGCGVIFQIKP